MAASDGGEWSAADRAAIARWRDEEIAFDDLPPKVRAALAPVHHTFAAMATVPDFSQPSDDWLRAILVVAKLSSAKTPAHVKEGLLWTLPELLAERPLKPAQVRARVGHLKAIFARARRVQRLRIGGRPWKDERGDQVVRGRYVDEAVDVYMYWIVSQLAQACRRGRDDALQPKRRHSKRLRTTRRRSAAAAPRSSRTKRTR